MRIVKLMLPAALLLGGAMVWTTSSFGKPEYAKKETKSCTFCHVKVVMTPPDAMHKDPNLTDAGKYYAAHDHSLAGYKAPEK
jgi:hypothetical protein